LHCRKRRRNRTKLSSDNDNESNGNNADDNSDGDDDVEDDADESDDDDSENESSANDSDGSTSNNDNDVENRGSSSNNKVVGHNRNRKVITDSDSQRSNSDMDSTEKLQMHTSSSNNKILADLKRNKADDLFDAEDSCSESTSQAIIVDDTKKAKNKQSQQQQAVQQPNSKKARVDSTTSTTTATGGTDHPSASKMKMKKKKEKTDPSTVPPNQVVKTNTTADQVVTVASAKQQTTTQTSSVNQLKRKANDSLKTTVDSDLVDNKQSKNNKPDKDANKTVPKTPGGSKQATSEQKEQQRSSAKPGNKVSTGGVRTTNEVKVKNVRTVDSDYDMAAAVVATTATNADGAVNVNRLSHQNEDEPLTLGTIIKFESLSRKNRQQKRIDDEKDDEKPKKTTTAAATIVEQQSQQAPEPMDSIEIKKEEPNETTSVAPVVVVAPPTTDDDARVVGDDLELKQIVTDPSTVNDDKMDIDMTSVVDAESIQQDDNETTEQQEKQMSTCCSRRYSTTTTTAAAGEVQSKTSTYETNEELLSAVDLLVKLNESTEIGEGEAGCAVTADCPVDWKSSPSELEEANRIDDGNQKPECPQEPIVAVADDQLIEGEVKAQVVAIVPKMDDSDAQPSMDDCVVQPSSLVVDVKVEMMTTTTVNDDIEQPSQLIKDEHETPCHHATNEINTGDDDAVDLINRSNEEAFEKLDKMEDDTSATTTSSSSSDAIHDEEIGCQELHEQQTNSLYGMCGLDLLNSAVNVALMRSTSPPVSDTTSHGGSVVESQQDKCLATTTTTTTAGIQPVGVSHIDDIIEQVVKGNFTVTELNDYHNFYCESPSCEKPVDIKSMRDDCQTTTAAAPQRPPVTNNFDILIEAIQMDQQPQYTDMATTGHYGSSHNTDPYLTNTTTTKYIQQLNAEQHSTIRPKSKTPPQQQQQHNHVDNMPVSAQFSVFHANMEKLIYDQINQVQSSQQQQQQFGCPPVPPPYTATTKKSQTPPTQQPGPNPNATSKSGLMTSASPLFSNPVDCNSIWQTQMNAAATVAALSLSVSGLQFQQHATNTAKQSSHSPPKHFTVPMTTTTAVPNPATGNKTARDMHAPALQLNPTSSSPSSSNSYFDNIFGNMVVPTPMLTPTGKFVHSGGATNVAKRATTPKQMAKDLAIQQQQQQHHTSSSVLAPPSSTTTTTAANTTPTTPLAFNNPQHYTAAAMAAANPYYHAAFFDPNDLRALSNPSNMFHHQNLADFASYNSPLFMAARLQQQQQQQEHPFHHPHSHHGLQTPTSSLQHSADYMMIPGLNMPYSSVGPTAGPTVGQQTAYNTANPYYMNAATGGSMLGQPTPGANAIPSSSYDCGLNELSDITRIIWTGGFTLKNDSVSIAMNFVCGNLAIGEMCLGQMAVDGMNAPLRISQRMRLEQNQLEGVQKKLQVCIVVLPLGFCETRNAHGFLILILQMDNEHCILIALPYGLNAIEQMNQANCLKHGFIDYLQEKKAAGIVNVTTSHVSALLTVVLREDQKQTKKYD
jgi:hypothetical protein